MKKKKNNELQRIMVISFSKEIPIHHEPMITFIVTISIPFFLLTDISIVLPDRIIVQLQNWNSRERLEISSGDLRSEIAKGGIRVRDFLWLNRERGRKGGKERESRTRPMEEDEGNKGEK